MLQFGLIGYPLEHSLSPPLHLAAFQELELDADYQLYSIHPFPQGEPDLAALLSRVRSGQLHGLNVTIPHKQNVIPFLDDLTPAARAIGAVNTIYLRDQKLMGDNTDAPGFWQDLVYNFGDRVIFTVGEHPKRALILGAGGSARAVLYALVLAGWDVIVAARRLQQAQQLVDSFQSTDYSTVSTAVQLNYQGFNLLLSDLDLIVNATPLGMWPKIDESPWPEGLDFPAHAMIYDLVYNPPETLLIRQARDAGLQAASGLGMLVEQAALADQRWTGGNPPREAMFAAVPQHLKGT